MQLIAPKHFLKTLFCDAFGRDGHCVTDSAPPPRLFAPNSTCPKISSKPCLVSLVDEKYAPGFDRRSQRAIHVKHNLSEAVLGRVC